MKVIDAYPPDALGKRPFCESKLTRWTASRNERWYKGNPNNDLVKRRIENGIPPDQCGHMARYQVDGKFLCAKHAGGFLLKKLAERRK